MRACLPELAAAGHSSREMPWPNVVMIIQRREGYFLDRFTLEGKSGGDTWHSDLDEARDQANAEYGGSLGAWLEIPEDLSDEEAIAFATKTPGQG